MPQRLAAIDFSERGARIISASVSLRKVELTSALTVNREPDEETWSDFLRRVHDALPERTDSVAVGIDSKRMSARVLDFPFSDLRKVDAAVEFELDGMVPYGIDDVAITWDVTDKSSKNTRVVASVIPKELLEQRLDECESAGLRVRVFSGPANSLGEVLFTIHPELRNEKKPIGVLAAGATESHFVVLKEGQVVFVRTLRNGGEQVDYAISSSLHLPLEDARISKEKKGVVFLPGDAMDADAQRMSTAVSKGLRPLLTSLAITLRALPADIHPEELYLTGGLSQLQGVFPFLQNSVGIPVKKFDLALTNEDISMGSIRVGDEYAPVLGMLLGLIRRGSSFPLNFRREEYSYQGDLQLYRGTLRHIALGLSIVILLALGASFMRYWMLGEEENRINQGFCAATKKIVGREICDPTAAIATMRQAPAIGEGLTIPTYSAATSYEAISGLISKSLDVQFEELDFRVDSRMGEPERITGKGEAVSFEATEKLVQSLKSDVCVEEVEVSKQRKTRNSGRVEFNLLIKMKCPAGVLPGSKVNAGAQAPTASPSSTSIVKN